MNERDVLACNPFEGDFSDQSDRRFSDKLATARKPGPCHDCGQIINPGERIRRAVWLFEGEVITYRWCRLCCEAMAVSWKDGGKAWEARIASRLRLIS